MSSDDEQLDTIASLADPVRRAVYRYVVDHAVGADRAQVAQALDLSRSLAAYHLDRLVEDGLLEARFEHRGKRLGPGSGRPSKIYDRAPTQLAVTLPPRDYSLAASVMAEALEDLDEVAVSALTTAAHRHGRRLREERDAGPAEGTDVDALTSALTTGLRACGYEPYQRDDGCLRMRNCPFDAVARDHRQLVCAMNLALLDGYLDPGATTGLQLALEPADDECCVTIRLAP